MTTYTKHNNLALMEAGEAVWGATVGANFDKIERGITIKGTAGTTISERDVIYLDSNFKFDKALAGGEVEEGKWIGFATSNMDINAQGYALHSGFVAGGTWNFSAGPVYLSDSVAGAVTQTEPANAIVTGFAIQTNEILIKPWVEGTGGGAEVGEGHITILPRSFTSKSGSWERASSTSQAFLKYFYASSGSGARINYKVYLSEGVYNFKYFGLSSANGGFMQVLLDDTIVGATIDLYSSSTQWNQTRTIVGITVSVSGVKEFSVLSQGKNSASGDYRIYLTCLNWYRTS